MTHRRKRTDPARERASAPDTMPAVRRQHHGLSVGVSLVLTLLVAALLSIAAFLVVQGQITLPGLSPDPDDPDDLLVISTRTPTPVPVHTPTRTRIVVAIPTRRTMPAATTTRTASAALANVTTLTVTPTALQNHQRTPAPASSPDPLPTQTPVLTPIAPALPTMTPPPLPAPTLVEPPAGAVFEDKVRFKFTWTRRLLPHEKFSLYIRSTHENAEFDWWVSEQDILHGGGAIHAVPGGFLYEVNSGLGRIPSGEAVWKVAVFDDRLEVKRPVCGWSEERGIVKR